MFKCESISGVLRPRTALAGSIITERLRGVRSLAATGRASFNFRRCGRNGVTPHRVILRTVQRQGRQVLPRPRVHGRPLRLLSVPSLVRPGKRPRSPSFTLPSRRAAEHRIVNDTMRAPVAGGTSTIDRGTTNRSPRSSQQLSARGRTTTGSGKGREGPAGGTADKTTAGTGPLA